MSKLNSKIGFASGIIAGKQTNTAGKYSDYELLRRVTLANLLFESDYYQPADEIMAQIENLCYKVTGQQIIDRHWSAVLNKTETYTTMAVNSCK